jgi:putative membrane protein
VRARNPAAAKARPGAAIDRSRDAVTARAWRETGHCSVCEQRRVGARWPTRGFLRMPTTVRYWVLQTVAMMLTALVIPRLRITSIIGAIGILVALAFVNATLWSAALFFSVPASPTVEALVLVLANGAIFWVLCKLLPGIEVQGVLPAIVAPVVFTLASMLIARYGDHVDPEAIGSAVADSIRRLRQWLEKTRVAS